VESEYLVLTKLVWTVTHAAASRAAGVPGLQDLLLHSRVLGRASGQELQNELGGFRLAGTGLATARDMSETRREESDANGQHHRLAGSRLTPTFMNEQART
jgi:hypothetical protein